VTWSELYRDPSGAPIALWSPPSLDLGSDPSTPDVSRMPGAVLVASVVYGAAPGTRVRAGCARGPSDRFAKGIEDVLFDRATSFALATEGVTPDELAVVDGGGAIEDGLVSQHRSGKAKVEPGAPERAIALEHVLTFAGRDRDVLLCSVLCVGPRTSCEDVSRSLHVEGAHALPPPPSLLTRSVFFAADHPLVALALVGLVFVGASAFIVNRRSRGRMTHH